MLLLSNYRRYHSTETAAMKVWNDLLLAADDGDVTVLCLLDLTAASTQTFRCSDWIVSLVFAVSSSSGFACI